MSQLRQEDLDFFIKHNKNVLFIGERGVGKTAIVKAAFERNGLKYAYFSAATMDPWVDFVGVPREAKDEKGESYLDLVIPKRFRDDDVEAIFFDELNRSAPKVRNAVMELLQFKSINGREFKNLRVIWAAINPVGDHYDTEKLDLAQEDRFHAQIEIPYELDANYFIQKYDMDVYNAISSWWKDLPDNIRKQVSPRRVDYWLEIWKNNGPVRDYILPMQANVTKLLTYLARGNFKYQFAELIKNGDETKLQEFITNPANTENALVFTFENRQSDLIKHFSPEVFSSFLAKAKQHLKCDDTNERLSVIKFIEAMTAQNKSYFTGHMFEVLGDCIDRSREKTLTSCEQNLKNIFDTCDPTFQPHINDLFNKKTGRKLAPELAVSSEYEWVIEYVDEKQP